MEDLEFNEWHDNEIEDNEITGVRHEIKGVENGNIFDKISNDTVTMMIPMQMTKNMS